MNYNTTDKRIISFLQDNLPLQPHPYQELAATLGLTEDEVVDRIKLLQQQGVVRRLGSILRHQQAGYSVNAMVAWMIDDSEADDAGLIMAKFKEVSHCYQRKVPPDFKYALFTMIHAKNDQDLLKTIEQISFQTGIKDYLVIKSIKELKKVSMKYF